MLCPKCNSEHTHVVSYTVDTHKVNSAFFYVWLAVLLIPLCVGIFYIAQGMEYAKGDMLRFYFDNEEMTLQVASDLEDFYRNIIIGSVLLLSTCCLYIISFGIKILMPNPTTTQIIGVCSDCGETWIIPVRLKEFTEDEVYQAKRARKSHGVSEKDK